MKKGNGLVAALYDAALGHQPWEEVRRQINGYVQGTILMLSTQDARTAAVDVVAMKAVAILRVYRAWSKQRAPR